MEIEQGSNILEQSTGRMMPFQPKPSLDSAKLKQMVLHILSTRPDEIGCEKCFEKMDHFVEMTVAGKNAAQVLPLVQDHLERCPDCFEEFEALLDALRALA